MSLIRRLSHSRGINRIMKLVQFELHSDKKVRIGVLKDNKIVDINGADNSIPNSLVEFLIRDNALDTIRR